MHMRLKKKGMDISLQCTLAEAIRNISVVLCVGAGCRVQHWSNPEDIVSQESHEQEGGQLQTWDSQELNHQNTQGTT